MLNQSRKKISCKMRPQCRFDEKEAVPLCRLERKREPQSVARPKESNKESSENEAVHRYEI
jgi:hypothetical protein